MNALKKAAQDVRYLVDRGFSKESAIRFVGDHYRLFEDQRFVLNRVVVASEIAGIRRQKTLPIEAMEGKVLFIDGYNVLISVESILGGRPVYICDDGFLRDIQGIFRNYKISGLTAPALEAIINLLLAVGPSSAEVLLDQQISMSGKLATAIREVMAQKRLPGNAITAKDVDSQLKDPGKIVATADGNVIDKALAAVDIPKKICQLNGYIPQILNG